MRIAVVEESIVDRDILKAYLERYQEERATSVDAEFHADPELFLNTYMMRYDIIFIGMGDEGFDGIGLARRIRKLHRRDHSFIILPYQAGKLIKADMNDMRYFESDRNRVTLHCKYGTHSFYSSLKELEERLDPTLFVRCNSCYLVNLRFVTAVEGDLAIVDGERLAISRAKKKAFLEALSRYTSSIC